MAELYNILLSGLTESQINAIKAAWAITSGGAVAVEDEGTEILAVVSRLNFAGAGVTVTDAGSGEVLITIPGGGGGSTVAVEDEGTEILAAASRFNFAGAGVTVTDTGSGEVLITIPGGSGGGGGSAPLRGALVHKTTGMTGHNLSSGYTTISFDAEVFDTDAVHDTGTNPERLTVPAGFTGYARVTSSVQVSNLGVVTGVIQFEQRKNGAEFVGSGNHAGGTVITVPARAIQSAWVPVTGGDYFTTLVHVNADTSVDFVANYTWMQLELSETNPDPVAADYSTSEHSTGASWIDGKPIYRKVVSVTPLPNNDQVSRAHGITGLDYVIHAYGNMKVGGVQYPIPMTDWQTVGNQLRMTIDATNIYLSTGIDYSAFTTAYIVIEYTKTP